MKPLFIYLPLIFFFLLSCGGEKGTPEAVQKAFSIKYPNEKSPKWGIDRNGNYEAQFKKKGEKYKADFTPEGQWIETENRIKKKNLPDAIKAVLERDYKEVKIVEVEHVMHYSKGEFYDVEIKKDGKKMDIEFNTSGVIIGTE